MIILNKLYIYVIPLMVLLSCYESNNNNYQVGGYYSVKFPGYDRDVITRLIAPGFHIIKILSINNNKINVFIFFPDYKKRPTMIIEYIGLGIPLTLSVQEFNMWEPIFIISGDLLLDEDKKLF